MTDGYRLAALKLYGLGARDRAWLLAQFEAPVRAKLRALLDDLGRTGLTPDDTAQAGLQPEAAREEGHGEIQNELSAVPPAVAALWLRREPDWIAATLVATGLSAWADGVLAEFDPVKRRAVTPLTETAHRVRPKVRQALAAALIAQSRTERTLLGFDRMLDQLEGHDRTPRRFGFLRAMVRRWTR